MNLLIFLILLSQYKELRTLYLSQKYVFFYTVQWRYLSKPVYKIIVHFIIVIISKLQLKFCISTPLLEFSKEINMTEILKSISQLFTVSSLYNNVYKINAPPYNFSFFLVF